MIALQRSLLVLSVFVAGYFGHTPEALAQSSKRSCVTAFEEGQREQLKGELERAAEQFTMCAAASCPTRVRAECQGFLETARSALPGALFAPVDSLSDRPLDGVSLSVDGGEGRVFDGRMVRMTPGEHQLVFQRTGYSDIRLRLTLRVREPPRLITLRFTPLTCSVSGRAKLRVNPSTTGVFPGEELPRPVTVDAGDGNACAPTVEERAVMAQGPPPRTQPPLVATPSVASTEAVGGVQRSRDQRRTAVIAAGLVGGLGAVGFAYFGISARSADLGLDACSPHCEPGKVDAIKRDYVLANVSLGVGLVGALTASVLWLTRPSAERPARVGGESPRRWALGVGPITTLATTF